MAPEQARGGVTRRGRRNSGARHTARDVHRVGGRGRGVSVSWRRGRGTTRGPDARIAMTSSNPPTPPGSTLPDSALRALVTLAPHMLSVLEPDGSVAWVNDLAREYFGFGPGDGGGDLRARVTHPDDLHAVEARRRDALSRGVPFDAEERLRGKDGQYRWFLVRYRPLKDGERLVRWFG